ncbi:MAG: 50S ribosomal protein L25/general stress protein Ctc [Actinomycetota bacterium]|nr:50S ribosomal protein L25/general stress protein Ctc [Actinomycetota bacterium]
MSEVRIDAEARTEFGKGGARRTRRAGRIPAVLYGHGLDPRHISLPAREFAHAMKGGTNTLLTVGLDGGAELALPKAIQRDPIRGTVEHVDLLLVRRGERVTVEIRVVLTGEPAPDTLVNHDLQTLHVEAEATHIPDGVTIDISGFDVTRSILARDVRLPSGTTLLTDPEALVVGFLGAPTAEQLEAELAEAEAEAGIEHEPTDADIEAAAEGEDAGTDESDSGTGDDSSERS